MPEDLLSFKARLALLLGEETKALQTAISLSLSDAPHAEVSRAIAVADRIRAERVRLTQMIRDEKENP
jgi:hypothetical protein